MDEEGIFQYIDGNGNSFTITKNSIRYKPVTPGESSSGFYSGGDPSTVPILQDEFIRIKTEFENALDSPAHATTREKGTGLIRLLLPPKTEVIVRSETETKTSLEKMLRGMAGLSN